MTALARSWPKKFQILAMGIQMLVPMIMISTSNSQISVTGIQIQQQHTVEGDLVGLDMSLLECIVSNAVPACPLFLSLIQGRI